MNCEGLHSIEGLHFMPVKADKTPLIKNWNKDTTKHDLSDCAAVGLVCGSMSGGVEVIDVDAKYDLTGDLFDRYKNAVHHVDSSLLNKLVVEKTKGGGYHLIYRCQSVAGNIKLANRHTTHEEKKQTFDQEYKSLISKSVDDAVAKERAKKAAEADKVRVLFETRGEGGYIMCFPSKGYDMIFGDFYSIGEITPDEREILHMVARQFNEVVEEFSAPKPKTTTRQQGLSPFDDYNERGDVLGLLESHGWKLIRQKGPKTMVLRPGQTTSQTSGNFDQDKNWFSVFTTSTEFEPEKAYLPYAVFCVLECGKNFSDAAKKLYDLGYGDRHEIKKEPESTRVIKSRVSPNDEDYSFLASASDYDGHLAAVRNGTLAMGKTTGIPSLDRYFLFKDANLVMVNGHDNSGKSVVMWYLGLLSAMYHGWNWAILSSENTVGAFMRKMIEFYWGKQLGGNYAMSDEEYREAKTFVEYHFFPIKAEEELYNYKDVINMFKKSAKKLQSEGRQLNCALVDPYNSLKIDLSGFSKLSTHEYHYEALSELKMFGRKSGIGLYINHHAVTAALRAKDGEKKYPIAPQKADTEGGGKNSNKADDFLTIHRIAQHPTDWMVTEIHVRKIKETETGGRVTPFDSPVKLEMYKNGCAFVERNEDGGRMIDPVYEWHVKRGSIQGEMKQTTIDRNMRMPYADDPDPF